MAVGSSLVRVTCETSQVLLAGGQVVFLRDLPLSPHLAIEIIKTGRKTQLKKYYMVNVTTTKTEYKRFIMAYNIGIN